MNDLKFALRQLLKNPGFTAVAVLTLALGIGGSTAVFSLINTVILRPLPLPEPDRLILVWTTLGGDRTARSAYGTYADWKEHCTVFDGLAAYDGFTCLLTGPEETERINGTRTSANFFTILQATPVLGRTFTEEEASQRARVVVVSHRLWQRRFGGDPDVVGRTMEIDGQATAIIGVMPEHFAFPSENSHSELWQLQSPEQPAPRGPGSWFVLGRLKKGETLDRAQTELRSVTARLAQAYPGTNRDLGARVLPLSEEVTGANLRLALWILLGAVAFVLLIGCSNLANLLLARGIARRRELATRLALGASPLRVVRQLIIECLPIGTLGGLAGVALALLLVWVARAVGGTRIPRLEHVGLDPVVMCFALALTLLATLLFATIPGLQVRRLDINELVKQGARGTGGLREKSLRHALLVGQVALAFVLLFGAGLLVRSFQSLRTVDIGFDPERVLCANIRLPQTRSRDQALLFFEELNRRLEKLPGVQAVGLTTDVFGGGNASGVLSLADGAVGMGGPEISQLRRDSITPGCFQAMGAPLLRGRSFDGGDRPESQPVAIINDTMARQFWPGHDPLGKRFKFGRSDSAAPWLTVVGVVGDMRRERPERAPLPQVFRPLAQAPSSGVEMLVKAASSPLALAGVVRQEIRSLDKGAVVGITTLEQRINASLFEQKFQTGLLSVFSLVALALAAVGTYGIVHFSVQQRTREIGMRIALGAHKLDVLSLIVGQGLKPVLLGVSIGVALAFATTRVLERLLFQIEHTDPLTFGAVSLLLVAVALFACWLPARRAARIDPMEALRYE